MRRMWIRVQEIMGQSVTILQENLSGIHVVKAFAAEEYESKKYARKVQELREEHFKSERLQGTESAWMTLCFTLALGLILWYGGWEVIRGDLTPGGLAMFLLYMNQLTFPIRMTPFIINSFSRASASGRRLFDVLDAQSAVEEKPDAKDMGRAQGHVRFDDVSFSYEHQTPVLKHMNISVPPGSVIALLGAPGSGKSTIVNLLPRFYDVTEGQITIDRKDIRNFTLGSLRAKCGHCAARRLSLHRHHKRKLSLRCSGRFLRGHRPGGQDSPASRPHREPPRWVRHLGGRARSDSLGRSETAALHSPHDSDRPGLS